MSIYEYIAAYLAIGFVYVGAFPSTAKYGSDRSLTDTASVPLWPLFALVKTGRFMRNLYRPPEPAARATPQTEREP